MKIRHFILLLPFLAAACDNTDETAGDNTDKNDQTETTSIHLGEWTLVHKAGYELSDEEKEEWDDTISDREWLIFHEDGTYTQKIDEEENGTISYESTSRYTIDGNRLITHREVDGNLEQTILKLTDSELVLEEFTEQPEYNYKYKNTKTYQYVE